MFEGDIYLSVQDLMKLMGSYSEKYGRHKHLELRKELGKKRKTLTIGDYCKLTGDDYTEIFTFLRGKAPEWLPEGNED